MTHLDKCGQRWTNLDTCGQMRRQKWTKVDKCGQMWTKVDGHRQTNVDRCGQTWTNMDNRDKHGQTLMFAVCVLVQYQMENGAELFAV